MTPDHHDSSLLSDAGILAFLRATAPFSGLDQASLEDLAERCTQRLYAPGRQVLTRGESQVTHLGLIQRGRVKVFYRDEDGQENLIDYRGPGMAVGALGILRGSLSNLDVVAVEETLLVQIARDDFLKLVAAHAHFSQHYLKLLSESYVGKALAEIARPKPFEPEEGSLYLFTAQVGDVVRRRPETIGGDATIQQAARRMSERKVGCLLITDRHGKIRGIITDRDLRTKVVAQGLDNQAPVLNIMTAPLSSVPAHTVCFDAMLEMMKRRVHHLPIERAGEIVGVLSAHDLMVLQGTSPLYLVREIMSQNKIENLYELSLKSPRVVRSLIFEGAKPNFITRMITLINDYVLERILTLLIEELGPPPVPFCWMLMGSEGRKEQTFRTDQDNGLLYADPADDDQAQAAQEYFARLGTQAIEHLVRCGFPRCKGDIMASNPKWRQPLSAWARTFDNWITSPDVSEVLHATIFFDFRPGYGDMALGASLRTHLMRSLAGREVFFRQLAKDTLTTPAALSFLRNFMLEKQAPHFGKFDLKTRGLTPFVDFARLMSLKHGIRETNTLERLQLLGENGHISPALQIKASQAYEFQMQLRLIHQLGMHEAGLEPDNYIDPTPLSDLEKRTLKEALAVVADIKAYLKEAFRLATA
jgi:CBS domain-containing protein